MTEGEDAVLLPSTVFKWQNIISGEEVSRTVYLACFWHHRGCVGGVGEDGSYAVTCGSVQWQEKETCLLLFFFNKKQPLLFLSTFRLYTVQQPLPATSALSPDSGRTATVSHWMQEV